MLQEPEYVKEELNLKQSNEFRALMKGHEWVFNFFGFVYATNG